MKQRSELYQLQYLCGLLNWCARNLTAKSTQFVLTQVLKGANMDEEEMQGPHYFVHYKGWKQT